jgi:hypothetical protein
MLDSVHFVLMHQGFILLFKKKGQRRPEWRGKKVKIDKIFKS